MENNFTNSADILHNVNYNLTKKPINITTKLLLNYNGSDIMYNSGFKMPEPFRKPKGRESNVFLKRLKGFLKNYCKEAKPQKIFIFFVVERGKTKAKNYWG